MNNIFYQDAPSSPIAPSQLQQPYQPPTTSAANSQIYMPTSNPYMVGQIDALLGLGAQEAGYPTQGSGSFQTNFTGNSGGSAYPYQGGDPSAQLSPVMNPYGYPNGYQSPATSMNINPYGFGNEGNQVDVAPSGFIEADGSTAGSYSPYDGGGASSGAYSPAPTPYDQRDSSGGWTGVTAYSPDAAVYGTSQGGDLFS